MKLLDTHFPTFVSLFPSQAFTQQERVVKERETPQWCEDDDALQTAQKTDFQKHDSQKGKGKRRKLFKREVYAER